MFDLFYEWRKAAKNPGILIGDLALAYYTGNRSSVNALEVMYVKDMMVPTQVPGWIKKTRSFVSEKTGTEIFFTCPCLAKQNGIAQGVLTHASAWPTLSSKRSFDPIKIVSIEGFVALKICSEYADDHNNVKQILKVCDTISLTEYPLSVKQLNRFEKIMRDHRASKNNQQKVVDYV